MNKLFTKIATAFVGIAMAIGVGVAVGSGSDVRRADAASVTFTFGNDINTQASCGNKSASQMEAVYPAPSGIEWDSCSSVGLTSGKAVKIATNSGSGYVQLKLSDNTNYITSITVSYDTSKGGYQLFVNGGSTAETGTNNVFSFDSDDAVTAFKISKTGSKALYLQSLVIVYDSGGSSCTHDWDSGVVTTAATCTTAGVKTYTCTLCSETKTEEIAALGHSWGAWVEDTAATCTTDGSHHHDCQRDGCDASEQETIPATGHNYVDGICTVCGAEEPKEVTFAYPSGTTTNMTGGNDAATLGQSTTDWSAVGYKGGNQNYPGLNTAGEIRLYGTNQNYIVFKTLVEGRTLTSISIASSQNNFGVYAGEADFTSAISSSTQSTPYSYDLGSSVTAFTIRNESSTQSKIQSITVAYTDSSTPTPSTLSVTYNGNDATSGDVPTDDNEYDSGDEVTVLGNTGNLAKTNCTFGGWNTQPDGQGTTYSAGNTFEITSNVTLYAKWTPGPVTYSVTYDDNGSTGGSVPTDATAYDSGDSVTVLGNTGNLEKTGYTFSGWNTQADGQGTSYSAGNTFNISANTTLYAKWQKNTTDIISWERAESTDTYTSGYTFTADAESKADYYQDGSGTVRSLTLYSSSSTLMNSVPSAVIITAKLGGGTAPHDLESSVYACYVDDSGADIANTSVVLTSTIESKDGTDFFAYLPSANITSAYGVKVYHTKETGYNVRYYSFTLSYSNQTIYTISYNSNGGEGEMPSSIGTNPAVAACTFTYENHSFVRWNTQADGEGDDYAVDATPAANLTLYAIWQETIAPIGGNVTMTGISGATSVTVNGHPGIKCGSGKAGGSMTLTLEEANITRIKVYVAGWSTDTTTVSVSIDNGTISESSLSLTSDANISGTGTTYALDGAETLYVFTLDITNAPADSVITLSTSAGSKRFVVWGATDLFAETFANEFMTKMTCHNGDTAPTFADGYDWTKFESIYNGLDAQEQGRLHDADALEGGTIIEQAMARYDYIEGRYNPKNLQSSAWKNFIGRTVTPIGNGRIMISIISTQTTNTSIIVIVTVGIAAIAIGGYFLLRKKKED